MTEPWFSPDIPRWLVFLSLLALLAVPAEQGRFKSAIMAIWIAALTLAGLLIGGAIVAVPVGQPGYVVRSLTIAGLVFAVAFGATLPALRYAYPRSRVTKDDCG